MNEGGGSADYEEQISGCVFRKDDSSGHVAAERKASLHNSRHGRRPRDHGAGLKRAFPVRLHMLESMRNPIDFRKIGDFRRHWSRKVFGFFGRAT